MEKPPYRWFLAAECLLSSASPLHFTSNTIQPLVWNFMFVRTLAWRRTFSAFQILSGSTVWTKGELSVLQGALWVSGRNGFPSFSILALCKGSAGSATLGSSLWCTGGTWIHVFIDKTPDYKFEINLQFSAPSPNLDSLLSLYLYSIPVGLGSIQDPIQLNILLIEGMITGDTIYVSVSSIHLPSYYYLIRVNLSEHQYH